MSRYDVPDLPISTELYTPGAFAETPLYDVPSGSQSTQPENGPLTAPESEVPYHGGSSVNADPYDVPGGSHGAQPDDGDIEVAPQAPEPVVQLYQDPDDPEFAIVVGTGPMAGVPGIAGLPISQFETDGDDFVFVPQ